MESIAVIKKQIEDKIASNQLILPTIPESLVRIRQALDDPDIPVNDIANVIAADPGLAAKIIKVSNSASFQRSAQPIENLQHAVTRLGNKLVQTLTINHALVQIFAKPHGLTGKWISLVQNQSLNVAAQAYALARHFSRLNPDDALLAGLLHNIGYLPLLQACTDLPEPGDIENPYWLAIRELYDVLGARILESWNLSKTIVMVAREHKNLLRNDVANPDMLDIIIVAQLTLPGTEAALRFNSIPETVPAASRLGIDSLESLKENQDIRNDFVRAYELLVV